MKKVICKSIRFLSCISACAAVILLCLLPAAAATTNLSGIYTMNAELSRPVGWTTQTVNFISGDVYYTSVTYEPLNEAYGVPALYYGSTRVYLFASDSTPGRWLPAASDVIDFGSLPQSVDSFFEDWIQINSEPGVTDPDKDAAADINTGVDGAISDLGGVSDAYDQLPKVDIDVDTLFPSQLLSESYLHLTSIISRFWDNPLLLVYSTIIGGLMVISFLLFASK